MRYAHCDLSLKHPNDRMVLGFNWISRKR